MFEHGAAHRRIQRLDRIGGRILRLRLGCVRRAFLLAFLAFFLRAARFLALGGGSAPFLDDRDHSADFDRLADFGL